MARSPAGRPAGQCLQILARRWHGGRHRQRGGRSDPAHGRRWGPRDPRGRARPDLRSLSSGDRGRRRRGAGTGHRRRDRPCDQRPLEDRRVAGRRGKHVGHLAASVRRPTRSCSPPIADNGAFDSNLALPLRGAGSGRRLIAPDGGARTHRRPSVNDPKVMGRKQDLGETVWFSPSVVCVHMACWLTNGRLLQGTRDTYSLDDASRSRCRREATLNRTRSGRVETVSRQPCRDLAHARSRCMAAPRV